MFSTTSHTLTQLKNPFRFVKYYIRLRSKYIYIYKISHIQAGAELGQAQIIVLALVIHELVLLDEQMHQGGRGVDDAMLLMLIQERRGGV